MSVGWVIFLILVTSGVSYIYGYHKGWNGYYEKFVERKRR
jgi:hypothetical protein